MAAEMLFANGLPRPFEIFLDVFKGVALVLASSFFDSFFDFDFVIGL